jgi:hypothetical protein
MATAATKLLGGKQGWRFAVWLVLIAFTLQCFVEQIHIDSQSQGATAVHSSLASTSTHGKAPINNNSIYCPFCQAVAYGGAFFQPATPLFLLSEQWLELAPPHLIIGATANAATHNWQSRAPPRS